MSRTVFLTGITGFIAKHIALKLLEAGHSVVGSTRSLAREDEVKDALRPQLGDPGAVESRLRLVALDLTRDDGWAGAMQGADALIHTASPFPLTTPKDENALIVPAVEGARRALRAAQAAGIDRVVLTSSVAAVMVGDLAPGKSAFDEDDWSDVTHATMTPYPKSKTLAERAAWDLVRTEAPAMALTVINPGMVLGAPLDMHYATSIQVAERFLRRTDPMLPRIGFPIVDVRDVAEMHLRALDRPETGGKRYLAAERSLWFREIGETLRAAYPDRRIVTREAPDLMLRFMSLFDPAIRSILPALGTLPQVANARARDEMGMEFIPAEDALRSAAKFLTERAGL